MGEDMHEMIAARFVESGAVNFEAAGKFLTEIGPELAVRDNGLHGFAFGKFNMLACFLRPEDLTPVFKNLRGMATLNDAVDISTGE
jgi:hypothetical protein